MLRFIVLSTLLLVPNALGFEVPKSSSQCIVGLADDWSSSHARLQRFQKVRGRWQPVGNPIPARLGKSGLAWGLGLHPLPPEAPKKKEGDWKAPAGVFQLGGVWGYATDVKRHKDLTYRQITPRDLWVEDSSDQLYNRHVILNHDPQTAWEKKQQMRQNDTAHSLKLFIKHNAEPKPIPGMGSSIFFHIWRAEGSKPTAGCTTMAASNLREIIAWIDPSKTPLYILLPQPAYEEFRKNWKLPGID